MSESALPYVAKVLVVDDVQMNLDAMSALLTRPDLEVLPARSGEAALEVLLRHEVALALLDVNMPGMDGLELAELMRSNPRTRSIPLIFITAAMQAPLRIFKGYQAGAVDFLHKPVKPEILTGKVDVFVELYRQRLLLDQRVRELQAALHTNEMLLAVLGHDLRSPLAAVINGAEALEALSPDERFKSLAGRVHGSSRRMERMVRQLLDFARARSGLRLQLADGSMLDLVDQVLGEFGPQAGERIRVEARGDVRSRFDRDRLCQVLSNLVGNALEHGKTDVITIMVDGAKAPAVELSIHNAGVIPPAQIAHIFDPFHSSRGGRELASAGGLGLGLYIVKLFVESHGGSVDVQSSDGDGTRFVIRLPRDPVEAPRPRALAGA